MSGQQTYTATHPASFLDQAVRPAPHLWEANTQTQAYQRPYKDNEQQN